MSSDKSLHITPLSDWWFSTEKPFLISGPCSVETQEQMLQTAEHLANTGKVQLLRGGIWKPRTRPDSFEGIGKKGLPWMVEAREKTGLPITTEVATAHHVELCLKHNFDALWIGARTTVNPFSVQEIAEALRGVDIRVFIKNPINVDLQLWIGAIERIHRAGIHRIAAIHRGFSFHGQTMYRNQPMWEVPIELKRLYPQLPLFCDPSHICGRRDLLQAVAQKALDLDMQGLMIESHIDPDNAWSDAKQQITPEALSQMIDHLHVRSSILETSSTASDDLAELRKEIDHIDTKILELIGQRMGIAEEIGKYKKAHDIIILQLERWEEIRATRSELARELGLTETFIESYLNALHAESIRTQTKVMNQSSSI